jgi:hypothetical protein
MAWNWEGSAGWAERGIDELKRGMGRESGERPDGWAVGVNG